MTTPQLDAHEIMRALQSSNRELLRATAREQKRRAAHQLAADQLRDAKRRVKLLIDALQPELPALGAELPGGLSHDPS